MFGISLISKLLERRSLRSTIKISILGLINNLHREDIRKFRFVNFVGEEKDRLIYASWLGKITFPVYFYFDDSDCLEQVLFIMEHKSKLGISDYDKNQETFALLVNKIISPLINKPPTRSNNSGSEWKVNNVDIQLLFNGVDVRLILEKNDDNNTNAG